MKKQSPKYWYFSSLDLSTCGTINLGGLFFQDRWIVFVLEGGKGAGRCSFRTALGK